MERIETPEEVARKLYDAKIENWREEVAKIITARDAAIRASGWISVDERLPEDDSFVIASDGSEVIMLNFSNGSFGIKTINGDIDANNITHWMPLPEPPAICRKEVVG